MIPASGFARFKREPLVMATAYDFPFAQVMEEAGVDVIADSDQVGLARHLRRHPVHRPVPPRVTPGPVTRRSAPAPRATNQRPDIAPVV